MTRLSIKFFLITFTLSLIFSCGNTGETETPTTDQKTNTSKDVGMYTYGDGSGNIYTITTDSILFDPVSVVLSSNDEYEGPKPARVGISKSQHSEIRTILDSALADESNHIKKRVKNSSAIALFRPRQARKKCLLAPGSGSQLDIENALKKLTGQEQ